MEGSIEVVTTWGKSRASEYLDTLTAENTRATFRLVNRLISRNSKIVMGLPISNSGRRAT